MDDLQDVEVPAYYVLNRHLPKEHAGPILTALAITPIDCAIITDLNDAALALELSTKLLRVPNDTEAHKLALALASDGGCVALVLGEAEVLDAYYSDSHKEPVACTA